MSGWEDITAGFRRELAELSTEQLRMDGEKSFRLALIGAAGSGKTTLARALAGAETPQASGLEHFLPEYTLPLSAQDVAELNLTTLLILLLDATKGDYVQEVAAADYLAYLGKPMLVCYTKMDTLQVETRMIREQARWRGAQILPLIGTQPDTVLDLLVPAVLEALPGHRLALANRLALFRAQVADEIVRGTAQANATFAAAKGMGDLRPSLRFPFDDDDLMVMCANLAEMTERLGIAYAGDLVLGNHSLVERVDPGQVWRQMSRHVLGLVPVWSLRAKVALAYGGTAALGQAVEHICSTGAELDSKSLQGLYKSVARDTRAVGDSVLSRAKDALPSGRARGQASRRPARPWSSLLQRERRKKCGECSRMNPSDALYCAYCGVQLGGSLPPNANDGRVGTNP